MKTLHIHIKTDDLDKSVGFYSAMFGAEPTQLESDYAKWLLDDPRAHVSLSTHGGTPGFDHAGISIDTREELDEIAERLGDDVSKFSEEETTCCYAKSNKHWVRDPQGTTWELFQSFDKSETYGAEPDREMAPMAVAKSDDPCCAPAA
ncbi:MAG: glyoxalase/bleomycin resistance/dioxygenase family protein [Marinicaulis sp.]|nr:glyoxalase/bleomycin resistance/dioxygenase family protein [Marinicaulis sp.]